MSLKISLVRISNGWCRCLLIAILSLLFVIPNSRAYSVLTHEQVVDLLWKDQIEPLLRSRFPQATDEDLRKAHAYAYGGSLVQDMGYYPFGNKYFSDLVHYVRSGDFVVNLIQQSSDLNEFAFALGALAHYAADNAGHPTINRVVALEFPKLKQKFGDNVTYADDPKSHIRTEFGFDMVQVAKNRYTSDRYHDFVGFEISQPVLERAFLKTYNIRFQDVISNPDLAIGTFRRAISKIIPEMTRVALVARKQEIVKDTPNFDKKKFLYYLSRANYEKEWGKGYRKPGVGTRILAWFLKIVPKVGPFNALAFKVPTTQGEDLYIKSVDSTIDSYKHVLHETKIDNLSLSNKDCDTGKETVAGEYSLTDKAYAKLLDKLSERDFHQLTPELQQNIIQFYGDLSAPIATKKNKKDWAKTLELLDKLKAAQALPWQNASSTSSEP